VSSGYLIRETGGNLRRNLAMTVAAVITMFVSLAAAGGVLIMRQAIHEQAVQWRGGVQVAIFLNPSVSPSEVKAVGKLLAEDRASGTGAVGAGAGLVKKYFYVDKTEAYHEFKIIFGGDPQLVRVMSPAQMPPSYRVVPRSPSDVTTVGDQFRGQPGVFRVAYAAQAIQSLENRFRTLSEIAVILAVGVMIGAVALIVNTIQLAIFARRREVAVMKLVGATNWFIRIPFMLEGLVDGVLGALLAFLPIYFARRSIASFVGSESLAPQRLYVPAHDAIVTGLVMLLVGAAVGAIGSAFAVRRFLRV
jgi:cell division transport system permease protein